MNLVLDIGNTHIKIAFFELSNLVENMRLTYSDLAAHAFFLSKYPVRYIGISAVRSIPPELQRFLDTQKEKVVELGIQLDRLPITIKYKTPETLGQDRICNVLAAQMLFKSQNVLVVDMGTCNKYDMIDANATYYGGSIAPGFKMRLDAMHHYTDQLPLLLPKKIDQLIGDNTENSMLTGAYNGTLGEINFMIEQYNSTFSDLKVVLTGGFATYFEKALKSHIFADPYLTLKGMNEILHIQVDK